MNKFDEFRTRFINDESDPHIIMITEALPKNSRYSTSKAEFNIEGYDLFPEKFPIQDTRGDFSQKFKILSTSNIWTKRIYSFMYRLGVIYLIFATTLIIFLAHGGPLTM
jgi:hypothetical protein